MQARTPNPKTGAMMTMSELTHLGESRGAAKTPSVMTANTIPHSSGSIAMLSRPKNPDSTTRRSARVHGRRMSVFARSSALSRLGRTPWMMLVVSIMVLFPGFAGAAQRLHGVVLAVTPKTGRGHRAPRCLRFDAGDDDAVPDRSPRAGRPTASRRHDRRRRRHPHRAVDALARQQHERAVADRASPACSAAPRPLQARRHRARHAVRRPARPAVPVRELRGQDVVLAFVYTRCQDARMCPLISAEFGRLQRTIGTRPIHLVEVTLDPAYDRPAVLRRYATTFGADPKRWSLVVGDAEPTLDFAARFGIGAFPDPKRRHHPQREHGADRARRPHPPVHHRDVVGSRPAHRLDRRLARPGREPGRAADALAVERGRRGVRQQRGRLQRPDRPDRRAADLRAPSATCSTGWPAASSTPRRRPRLPAASASGAKAGKQRLL